MAAAVDRRARRSAALSTCSDPARRTSARPGADSIGPAERQRGADLERHSKLRADERRHRPGVIADTAGRPARPWPDRLHPGTGAQREHRRECLHRRAERSATSRPSPTSRQGASAIPRGRRAGTSSCSASVPPPRVHATPRRRSTSPSMDANGGSVRRLNHGPERRLRRRPGRVARRQQDRLQQVRPERKVHGDLAHERRREPPRPCHDHTPAHPPEATSRRPSRPTARSSSSRAIGPTTATARSMSWDRRLRAPTGRPESLDAARPSFSPDGSLILFSNLDTSSTPQGHNVSVVNADGSGLILLTNEASGIRAGDAPGLPTAR